LFDDSGLRDALKPDQDYRYAGGRITHRRRTPAGKKMWQSGNLSDDSLFGIEHLRSDDQAVYLCEGEKAVELLRALGCAAVATGGSQRVCDMTPLKDRDVLVVADRDDAGNTWAQRIRDELSGVAQSVMFLQSKADLDKADVVEHIAMGMRLDDLEPLDLDDEDPIPLAATVTIPPFPVDALPQPIADMITAVAEHTQTDPAMPGTSALSALSACTGGRAEIEVRPGWLEPLNLYTASIASPGERKSAVQMTMVKPVYAAERVLAEKVVVGHRDAATRKDIAVKNAERLRNAAAKQDDPRERDKFTDSAVFAATEADSIVVPTIPRLVCDDVTPEALGSLMAEQDGHTAIISAEGGVFDIIGGRYSGNIPNLDIWLKGHSGDPLRVDRKNRPPEYIPRPALTLGLMIQPSVLNAVAANREFRGRGLLARFLYAYPISRVGRRRVETKPVVEEVEAAYNDTVQKLACGMAIGEPGVLKLSPTAYEAVVAIAGAVEPMLTDDGELTALKDWGAKFVGAVARIAGILHFAEHGVNGLDELVSATTIRSAWKVGQYLKHAPLTLSLRWAPIRG
jgi:replicative DNA helicase